LEQGYSAASLGSVLSSERFYLPSNVALLCRELLILDPSFFGAGMPRASVSAVIPTKNVAEIIKPTLDSLRFCDEIVIVDMHSTDGTRDLCRAYSNVTFLTREDYIYGNFNFGSESARSEWIIRLDSDEVLSPELQESIISVLSETSPAHNAYDAECHLYFLGERLRHGFGATRRVTLFKKGKAQYSVTSEHEHLLVTGSIGRLAGHYDHFTNPTISMWLQKIDYYTDRDAERSVAPLERPLRVLYKTARMFQRLYLRPGWMAKDGPLGFYVSGIAAFSYLLQHAKLWERRRTKGSL
jgi:glycosyltransferase involved in cell wall biosynthesis